MRQLKVNALLLVVLCAAACSAEQPVEIGPVEHIAGLVAASAPSSSNPPELVGGFSPVVSAALAAELEQSGDVRVVVRVVVDPNGNPLGVKVVEVQPVDSAAAQQYSEAVSAAVWEWQYRAVGNERGILSLTFEPRPEG